MSTRAMKDGKNRLVFFVSAELECLLYVWHGKETKEKHHEQNLINMKPKNLSMQEVAHFPWNTMVH